ncbi:Card1-like endonuclease domain-containing protein [Pseudoalteromonas piscicida]|uniref:Card1 endonuclease domain-containing protein n=1 Tax=Pseudoalteromonas piscicida TaxID=43662 RepID=A0A2A5JUX7_PSEO7|nr:DUF1887 family CARF protein [Pseudoalteromonas piscicida]PCK33284.1 hypothetical protein CEX98_01955 [Pseudoalteromonas piscicida]
MTKHIHISFIDSNFINTLTPVLDHNIDSDEILYLIEAQQRTQLDDIKKVLSPRGIKVHYATIPTSRDSETLIDGFHQLIDQLVSDQPTCQFVFNASCGDRQHLLAMYEVIRAYSIECFIIEPERDELHWLVPSERANTSLADKLKIRDFFNLIDGDITDIANAGVVDIRYRQLGAKWATSNTDYGHALGQLNFLAASSEDNNLLSEPMSRSQLNSAALQTLIDDLEDADVATRQGDRLRFANQDARFFANGGWLEEYVYATLLSLKKELTILQDVAQGVAIKRRVGQGYVNNELDIVALANNKLHLIECKTKKFNKGEGNQVIYKLDSLSELFGGVQARGLLVSYKGIRTSERLRAKELEIGLICEDDLSQLKDKLRNWLREA